MQGYIYRSKDDKGRKEDVYFSLATIRASKRNSTFVKLTILVEKLSNIGLTDTLEKY